MRLALSLPIFYSILSYTNYLACLSQIWDPGCALGWRLLELGPILSCGDSLRGFGCVIGVDLGHLGVRLVKHRQVD